MVYNCTLASYQVINWSLQVYISLSANLGLSVLFTDNVSYNNISQPIS